MQTCSESDRVVDVEHGPGVVVRVIAPSRRGLEGGKCVEAFVRFDSGELLPVCVEDLLPEDPSCESGLKL